MLVLRVIFKYLADPLKHSFLHLSRCSLCKGNDKYAVYIDWILLIAHKGYDPLDKNGSLSAARSRADKKAGIPGIYYFRLFLCRFKRHFNLLPQNRLQSHPLRRHHFRHYTSCTAQR